MGRTNVSVIPAINAHQQLRAQEAKVTIQDLAEAIVKVFSENPDVLHVIIDILSNNEVADKELLVQKVLEASPSATHRELEDLIAKIAAEHGHLRSLG
jgi:hypothetical protein